MFDILVIVENRGISDRTDHMHLRNISETPLSAILAIHVIHRLPWITLQLWTTGPSTMLLVIIDYLYIQITQVTQVIGPR